MEQLIRKVQSRTRALAVGAMPGLASPVWLHFRRFLAHPFRVKAILPASKAWGALIASRVIRREGEFVVELGAGTGAVTRAMLESGIPANQLLVVEIDREMADFLRAGFPAVRVIEGDAFALAQAMPPKIAGRTGTVVCGIALASLSIAQQRELVSGIRSLLAPGGRLVVFSFVPFPPLPAELLPLKRTGWAMTLHSFPPGFVWTYEMSD